MTVTIHTSHATDLTENEAEQWRSIPVSVAVDLAPDEQLDSQIRPLNSPGKQPKLFGRAVTALCEPPDFGAVVHALECMKKGDVLVIAAGGDRDTAMIGEILGGHLRNKGCAGVICDGAVRDVATLGTWPDFSVFSRHVNPRGPTAASEGAVQLPIKIGNRLVNPGDLIIGDDDGLVALTPETVRSRINDANTKLALESRWEESLSKGTSVIQTFGIEPAKIVD